MKSILSLCLVFAFLFCAGNAVAQNAKWTKDPTAACGKTSVSISGMCTGLGSGPYYAKISGEYDCVNHGKQEPNAWTEFSVIVPLEQKEPSGTGGNIKLSSLLESLCDHANWTFKTRGLAVTVFNNPLGSGTPTIPLTLVGDCF